MDRTELSRKFYRKDSLVGADLRKVDLRKFYKNFESYDLTDIDLRGSNLTMVSFRHCNLYQADLRGTKLNGCNFERANLEKALYDEDTILPKFLRPDKLGMKFKPHCGSLEHKARLRNIK